MNFERFGLAADSEIRRVLVQHDGFGESGGGGLATERTGQLQLLIGLAPVQR